MVRQQEVCNALVDVIHMLAIGANQLPLRHLCLNTPTISYHITTKGAAKVLHTSSSRVCRSFSTCGSKGASSVASGFCAGNVVNPSYALVSNVCVHQLSGMCGQTSAAVILSASHSIRGRMFVMNSGLKSTSSWTSTASWKCRGKEREVDLQALTAQLM